MCIRDSHGGITRYSLSPEAIMARNEFIKRMKAIGAEIEIDAVSYTHLDVYKRQGLYSAGNALWNRSAAVWR